MIARSEEEWQALWALHAGPESEPPPIDFAVRIVAAAFGGQKPSSGYRVQIVDAREDADQLTLVVSEEAPTRDRAVAAVLTYPFHIVSLPHVGAAIAWEMAAPNQASAPAVPHRRTSTMLQTPTSTGLTLRMASTLAYVAGPLSGALMLLAESNDAVRFHAWQSIVVLGGLAMALLITYVLAFAALFVSTAAIALMIDVATVIWIVFAMVWVICLWKASSGERWKLPLAGDFAERLTYPKTS